MVGWTEVGQGLDKDQTEDLERSQRSVEEPR